MPSGAAPKTEKRRRARSAAAFAFAAIAFFRAASSSKALAAAAARSSFFLTAPLTFLTALASFFLAAPFFLIFFSIFAASLGSSGFASSAFPWDAGRSWDSGRSSAGSAAGSGGRTTTGAGSGGSGTGVGARLRSDDDALSTGSSSAVRAQSRFSSSASVCGEAEPSTDETACRRAAQPFAMTPAAKRRHSAPQHAYFPRSAWSSMNSCGPGWWRQPSISAAPNHASQTVHRKMCVAAHILQ
mmetsp:Transcript_13540/g.36025  ORF Transcript_13540/g.36025 Transcript_13540/m.36025 type:complete len:242 (+) Transcript_13540:309-1034(+)